MHREALVRIAIVGGVCLASYAEAVPPVDAPAEVGTLDRVQQSPPAALPERRRQAITLDRPSDGRSAEAMWKARAHHAFLAMDADGNGVVDRDERAGAKALFMFDFQVVDADGDGRISEAEHGAWARRQAR